MFCFKLRKTATETHKMLSIAYINGVPSCMHTFKWFKRIREDCEDLGMLLRTGHPSSNDIQDQLQNLTNWWPEMDIFTTEHETKTLYGNTGKKVIYAMQQPRRVKMSNTLQWKPEILYSTCLLTRPKWKIKQPHFERNSQTHVSHNMKTEKW